MYRLPVAVIPAYKPLHVVINIAKELINSKSFQGVICINDGSGKEFDYIFSELKALGVIVETHAVNLGKGSALKTGFNAALNFFPECCGVVTLDADGQHLSKDIINIADNLLNIKD
ncbi:MAG: glycosyltransferase, partial [Mucispirillum sp.]|nr:glycosyltransferase [Mucispirillum sp.]